MANFSFVCLLILVMIAPTAPRVNKSAPLFSNIVAGCTPKTIARIVVGIFKFQKIGNLFRRARFMHEEQLPVIHKAIYSFLIKYPIIET